MHTRQRGLIQTPFILAVLLMTMLCLTSGNVLSSEVHWDTRTNSVQIGNEVLVPEGTVTLGDAVAILGDVVVLGAIRGDAVAVGGNVRVEGIVSGDVVGVGGRVTLGEHAEVTGDVVVVGAGLDRAPGAKVMGSVNNVGIGEFLRSTNGLRITDWRLTRINPLSWHRVIGMQIPNLLGYLFYLAGLFALALLTISLFPRHVSGVAEYMENDWGRSALVGILTLLLIGPVTLLIAITIIGLPLAFLLWGGFFLAKMFGYVAFVSLLGHKVSSGRENVSNLAELALGVLILGFVRYIPIIGGLASFAVTIVTLGAVMDSKFGSNRPWLPPRRTA